MKNGAVAMIDALGFRGIWSRRKPEVVLDSLAELQDRLLHDLDQIRTQPAMQFEATFLSDTIVIALSLPDSVPDREALSVVYVSDIVGRVLTYSARSRSPLTYRGAITFGAYEIRPRFIIGRAIDEVAAHHESADAAIVWLLPQARDMVAEWLCRRKTPANTHLVSFGVPIKTGGEFHTYTVSPIVQARDVTDANAVSDALLATFDSPAVDVAVKKQNTLRHIEACYAWRGWQLAREQYAYEKFTNDHKRFESA